MLALTRIYAGQAADYLSNTLGAGLLGPGCADEVELVNSTSGRWWGRGCDWVGLDGPVGDRQLENLIVDGVHPDADRIFSERLQILRGTSRACAAAAGRATQLGRRWFVYRGDHPWRTAMHHAYQSHNLARGEHPGAPIDAAQRTILRHQVAAQEFAVRHHRAPADSEELRRFLRTFIKPAQGAVAAFELIFTNTWAAGPVRAAAARCAQAAVVACLEQLERIAAFTRTRGDGQLTIQPVDGVIAAIFPTSASTVDGKLGTRVVLSNKVRTGDGRWLTLDGRSLYSAIPELSATFDTWPRDRRRGRLMP